MNKISQLGLIRSLEYVKNHDSISLLSELSEDHLQAAVCALLDHKELLYFAIPNGSNKSKALRALFKFTGLIPGIPDLMVCISRGRFAGLFIELKHAKNKPSSKQVALIQQLCENGYACYVCWDLAGVEKTLRDYLELSK